MAVAFFHLDRLGQSDLLTARVDRRMPVIAEDLEEMVEPQVDAGRLQQCRLVWLDT
jgi:hypothetical protein